MSVCRVLDVCTSRRLAGGWRQGTDFMLCDRGVGAVGVPPGDDSRRHSDHRLVSSAGAPFQVPQTVSPGDQNQAARLGAET